MTSLPNSPSRMNDMPLPPPPIDEMAPADVVFEGIDEPRAAAAATVAELSEVESTQDDPPPVPSAGMPASVAFDPEALVARLADSLAPIEQRLQRLEQTVELKVSREEHLNKIIDQLHGEVQEHRLGMLRKLLEPLVLDLIATSGDYADMAKRERAKGDDLAAQALASLADEMCDELHDILSRYGFDQFSVPDDQFDATRQRAVRLETTGDRTLDGRVATRRRCGFQYNGQIVRPEQVTLYKFSPAVDSTPVAVAGTVADDAAAKT